MAIWIIFGAVIIGQTWVGQTWPVLVYSLLSLTVIRALPMVVALIS